MPPDTATETTAAAATSIAREKSLTERAVLLQSPAWMAAVAWVMLTGRLAYWADAELLLFSTAVAVPAVVVPWAMSSAPPPGSSVLDSYWLKLNAWVSIVVFWGTYYGTHFFFSLMGMRYAFANVRWTLHSTLLGAADREDGQGVPLFLYPLTHAYFMTYFVVLLRAERSLRKLLSPLSDHLAMARALVVLAVSYAVAYAETFFMAADVMSDFFAYRSRDRMLRLGSLGYAAYFVVGLPMVKRIDGGERWSLGRTVIEALATCAAIHMLLEAWAKVVGPL